MQSLKPIALEFQTLITKGEVRKAYSLYVHPDCIHHNPYFAGDRASLLTAMEENATAFPDKTFTPHTVIEEENMVAVHSSITLNSEMPEIAAVHIFRFQDGMIIEMWDIGQQVPPESQNKHGMF